MKYFFWISTLSLLFACQNTPSTTESAAPPVEQEAPSQITTIAFGSCGKQDRPQPVLTLAASKSPDLFIFLGDNIYGDSYNMDTIRNKYARWTNQQEFRTLRDSTTILATWDDHDFGWNDSGRHYPFKDSTKQIFLDAFEIGESDERRSRAGIYTTHYHKAHGKTIQVILLDTRTFRDNIRPYNGEEVDKEAFHYKLDYWPYEKTDSTLLGEAQWAWAEQELGKEADLRIIASSTQFGISYNGYEAWANFPHERQKMIDLIKATKANGVVFISGDVHYAEVSKFEAEGAYPIYDVTSSGITSTWDFATPNTNRVAGPVMENHFGQIKVDWSQEDPVLSFQAVDVSDKIRFDQKVKLSELQFPTL